ncbi:hypothetical protein BRADI_3g10325v3 [Brachypodium distachyon]|uniref:Uncharacterized protein n=1 Tax=Brachypodium distachyon TaxID=15368 RepID=A0A2K2CWD3_BRADI|nr:hypothetical protein BRADI_3g10325v3 [Brachypodium distachyon]
MTCILEWGKYNLYAERTMQKPTVQDQAKNKKMKKTRNCHTQDCHSAPVSNSYFRMAGCHGKCSLLD